MALMTSPLSLADPQGPTLAHRCRRGGGHIIRDSCSIPDVCIDERRLPLIIARATLRDDVISAQERDDYPSNTGEDCSQRRPGFGAGYTLQRDARHHLSLAGADQL
jgi:hypothetical protein